MGTKNYIVALELGSSKVSGAVAVENYDGINVIAYTSEPVNGFIAKGVVRNIDETSKCLTSIINKLEAQLDGATIQKAYVALGGLSLQSIKSTVKREFSEYTKITQDIIDAMGLENDRIFVVPDGYQRVQVVTQEYKMNGDTSLNPIGMSVKHIECNYINIIIKEQFMKQLAESFQLAKIEIADSFTAARINAEQLLNNDEKRDGSALVDIGAETTTIAIYTNNLLRKLCVLPLGGANITRDLQAEHISQADAETLKIHAGYKAEKFGESSLSGELRDNIIGARMMEILQNIHQQIKRSGENISNAVITGGGAKLKNIELLLNDNLPGLKIRIVTEPFIEFTTSSTLKVKREEISATLLGLLKSGKENCCQEPKMQAVMQNMFHEEENNSEPKNETPQQKETTAPTENKKQQKEEKKEEKAGKKKASFSFSDLWGGWTESVKKSAKDFVDNATKEEDEYITDDDEK
ncbi:MAG: hypothetical protein IIV19_02785 [Bacteroidaceae bacterium]|nr:hypothetical protein [Bacteroidaceae bacterium]